MGVIDNAVSWALMIAEDDSHGYDQGDRWGNDYDCSSLIIQAYENAGVPVKTNGASYTGNMIDVFLSTGFEDVTAKVNLSTGAGLIKGDVVWKSGHVEMVSRTGYLVGASSNENGETTGGQTGDQTGKEIRERAYYNYPWTNVLRYVEATGDDRSRYIWGYFVGKIGNEYGVAGLMGNLEAESGLYPDRVQGDIPYSNYSKEYTSKVDAGTISENSFVNNGPNGGGYGLAQWTYPARKQALYDLYKSGGYSSIGSIKLACDYLWYELQHEFASVLSVLRTASSVREASDAVLHNFERPADQSEAVEIKRAGMGQAWYNLYAGTKPKTEKKGLSLLLMWAAIRR